MGQLGFFDADKRLAALSAKGDPLEAIDRLVPWETFRADIEAAVLTPEEMRKSSAGRKPLDAIVMLPDQLFYNTGIFSYVWLLRNNKPKSHRGRVMIIDARKQFEKEPKSFGNKRNRITEKHRQWVEDRYRNGWEDGYSDEAVKLFTRPDFAYHKVSVVFWQFDENPVPIFQMTNFEGLHSEYIKIPIPQVGDPNPAVKIGVIDIQSGKKVWLAPDETGDYYIPRIYWTSNPDELAVMTLNRSQNHM